MEATHEGSEESEAGQGEDDESLLAAEARDTLGAQAGGLGLSKAGAEVVAVVTRPLGSDAGTDPAEAGAEAEVEAGATKSAGGECDEDTSGVEAGVPAGGEDGDCPRVAGGTEAGGR